MNTVFNRIFLASDHAGVNVKSIICEYLRNQKDYFNLKSIVDFGPFNTNRTDYPLYAKFLSKAIKNDEMCGILFCARGVGMSIAANRFSHIRAGLCMDVRTVFFARSHSNTNILVISADAGHSQDTLHEMIKTFLTVNFAAGRYQERLDMISLITSDSI